MIPDTFVSQLLDRVDLVEVVQRYVRLKKAGSEWSGLCPFHTEKTPSFTVSPAKQFYHCFGCGAHGTAIGFLMHQAGLSFREAVEELAQQSGLTVPEDNLAASKKEVVDPSLQDILSEVAIYYKQQLKGSPFAINYLKSREITGQTAAKFGLGYAPEGYQNLQAAFPKRSVDDFLKVGLMIPHERGHQYDRFRHRLMFPIINDKGKTIGFGARSLDGSEPKYLNSPETALFSKGRELYGLFQAKQAIAKAGCCWITEGYFDVIRLHQAGISHAVASLGTAVTADQLRKLLRYTDRLYFCFDGDNAGKKAAARVMTVLVELLTDQRQFFFQFLPAGQDPDSFVQRFGRDQFEALQVSAVSFSQWLIQTVFQGKSREIPEDRAAALSGAGQLLKKMTQAPLLKAAIVAELAEKTGLSASQIEAVVTQRDDSSKVSARQTKVKPALQTFSLLDRLLSIMIHRPDWRDEAKGMITESKRQALNDGLFWQILSIERSGEDADFLPFLQGQFSDTTSQDRLERASDFRWAACLTEEELKAEWAGGLVQLEQLWRQRELDRFHRLMMERPLTDMERQDMDYLLGLRSIS